MACSFVQALSSGGALGSAGSVAGTWLGNTTSGNGIVGAVTYGAASDVVASIVDTQTNTYVKIGTITDTVNGQSLTFFYAKNIAGGTTPTITVNFSTPVQYRDVAAHEVLGANTTSQPDSSASSFQATVPGGTDNITSGTATVLDGSYVFAATMDSGVNTGTITQGTGFGLALDTDDTIIKLSTEHLIKSGAGSQAGTFTQALNHAHITCMVALKSDATEAIGMDKWYRNTESPIWRKTEVVAN